MRTKDLRNFAHIWAFIFLAIGFYPLLSSNDIRLWSLLISAIFLSIGIIKPLLLTSFYKVWIKIGEFIGNIVSKIIMFMLYFGLFTPISIFLKIFKKDLLSKKINKSKSSYWITRESQPQSMKYQF